MQHKITEKCVSVGLIAQYLTLENGINFGINKIICIEYNKKVGYIKYKFKTLCTILLIIVQ